MNDKNLKQFPLIDHIILCGYTHATEVVIRELLKNNKNYYRIILISSRDKIEIDGVIYLQGDFSQTKILESVNIKDAKMAIIFAEPQNPLEDKRTVDLRTAMTVFNIKKANPTIHTISEIDFEENAEILQNQIEGDEIIYKGTIDANIIVAAVRHKYITPMIYEFLNLDGKKIEEITPKELGFNSNMEFVEIKKFGLKNNIAFLGFINTENKSHLAPENDKEISPNDRLIYLAEEKINV